jgi:Flp pilus assembly protein TadD
MGVVYLAVRSDGEFLQTVAIKLVKRGMDSEAIVQRFRTERQILAGLSHPHIAALLDGGTAPDGRPYLVMEHIDGENLLDYAASRNLAVPARLDLFRPLCRAVQFAHHHQVLHRDIKPANVMVTSGGIPKLLDFGIAKLLAPELDARGAPQTETHARLLTPDYASPEQIRGEPLTPASDIYSLGVLLYRLLTGRQPYSLIGRSLAEIERAITEETAPPASRAVEDPKLRSTLSGDLDTIIAMAMRKEPARRYASAADFDADLHRYLSGRAVLARPESLIYRARKFSRRHSFAVAATAACTLVGGSSAGLYWRGRRDSPPQEALELCRRAELLLRSDIRSAQPGQDLPAPLRESIALWTRATQIAPRHVPAWSGLAGAAEFAIDYDQRQAAELSRTAGAAVARALHLDPRSAPAHATRGALLFREWRFAEAARAFGDSIRFDPHQPYVVADYADCLNLSGQPQQALEVLRNGLQDTVRGQESHGPNVRAQVVLLGALSGQHRNLRQYELAREAAERAIRLQGNYAPARLQLGLAFDAAGDLRAAEREFEAAFAMRPGDQRAAAALGSLFGRQGRRTKAHEMIRHLEALQREGSPIQSSLALIHAALGEDDTALNALEAAVRSRESSAPYRFFDHRLHRLLSHPRARALASKIGITPLA